MNDRDILRHDRIDRVSTFGSENHADLPAGCEAITRFANLATLSAKLGRHKVGQLRGPASLQTLLDALWSDFKDIAPTDTPTQLAEKAALRSQFTSQLIPTDFVQDLRADRDAIDGKTLTNTADNLQGLESTESINVLLLQATQEVTHLDAMKQNLYRRKLGRVGRRGSVELIHTVVAEGEFGGGVTAKLFLPSGDIAIGLIGVVELAQDAGGIGAVRKVGEGLEAVVSARSKIAKGGFLAVRVVDGNDALGVSDVESR